MARSRHFGFPSDKFYHGLANKIVLRWFVIFGAAICGISAGLYWAAEGAIILSYPEHAKRGRYLALWLAFKNSGQVSLIFPSLHSLIKQAADS